MKLLRLALVPVVLWGCSGDKDDVEGDLMSDGDGDGYSENDGDCDDEDPSIAPDAEEVCDGVDNDCDGVADDDPVDGTTWYADNDGDGYPDEGDTITACDAPSGYIADDGDGWDCDDTDAAYNPGADESDCNDPNDYNCDGVVAFEDADGDGWAECVDCDDNNEMVNPGLNEVCDGLDNDCDDEIDEDAEDGTLYYVDADGDGYGDDDTMVSACDEQEGLVTEGGDCDDTDSAINPAADEICNEVDDDCDGNVDEDPVDGTTWYADTDGDGFGDSDSTYVSCDEPTGYVDNDGDCDDADGTEPVVVDASTGSSSGSGTIADPLDALQDGIDIATLCVVAYPGTYYEAIDFGGKDLTVTGVDGAEYTVIDAAGYGSPAVSFTNGETSAATLTGFTITGGEGRLEESSSSWACSSTATCTDWYSSYCGGGVLADGADPTLRELVITGNTLPDASSTTSGSDTYYTYSYGGGACMLASNATFTDVQISENHADQGGGLYLDPSSVITMAQSWVAANTAADGAGAQVDGGDLAYVNVASVWNDASSDGGGVLVVDGSLDQVNVTHGSDDAASGAGIYLSGTSTASVMNTIVYGAATGEGVLADASSSFTGTYNNVYGNAAGDYSGTTDPTGSSGNISEDPLFTGVTDDGDWTNDDWTLSSTSPSIDAGDPSSTYDDADGTTADQGAFGGPSSDWND